MNGWAGAPLMRELATPQPAIAFQTGEVIDRIRGMLFDATPIVVSHEQTAALPLVPPDECSAYHATVRLPFPSVFVEFEYADPPRTCGGLCWMDPDQGLAILSVGYADRGPDALIVGGIAFSDGTELRVGGDWPEDAEKWVGETSLAGARTVLSILYLVNSATASLAPVELHRRDAKRAAKRGWKTALTVTIRGRRDWHLPRDREGRVTDRALDLHARRGHYAHVTRGAHVVNPAKRTPCADHPVCRREWRSPTIVGRATDEPSIKPYRVAGTADPQTWDPGAATPLTEADGPRRPIPVRVRREVLDRDEHRCVECGADDDLQLDHVYPHTLGGEDTAENLRVLCGPCNRRKGASLLEGATP